MVILDVRWRFWCAGALGKESPDKDPLPPWLPVVLSSLSEPSKYRRGRDSFEICLRFLVSVGIGRYFA